MPLPAVPRAQARWVVRVFPIVGEAIASFQGVAAPRHGIGREADREALRRAATRRAKTTVRRYCVQNSLNRLGTLTYRRPGCYDHTALRCDVAEFWRQLRLSLDDRRFAYLWVGEWHPKGNGLHVHFAVGRFIQRALIAAAWPHGFVHIKLLGDLPALSSSRTEARRAAGYLSKYVGKTLGDGLESGLHRYEIAQGFQPVEVRFVGRSAYEVVRQAVAHMGGEAEYVSVSNEWEGYEGPPAVFLSWT
jgi:hypothetical protein